MRLPNPLVMNDWKQRDFEVVVLSILLAYWGALGLEFLGMGIPLLRAPISLVLLSLVPGMALLRALRIHGLGNTRTLLLAVGLSLFILMFATLGLNLALPSLGVSDPISLGPLTLAISAIVVALVASGHVADRGYRSGDAAFASLCLRPFPLLLLLLPLLAAIGAYILNLYNLPGILLTLVLVVSLIPLVVIFRRVPSSMLPLAVGTISLALLFHRTLISFNLWGWDVHTEYYFAQLTISNGFWEPSIYSNSNSILSTVLLAPTYSIMSGMDTVWVFKLVFTIFFALAPVALFYVYRSQVGSGPAFLASMFFVFIFAFYGIIPDMPRQEIAELFLALMLLSMLELKGAGWMRHVFFFIFGLSLVVSHYGLAFLFVTLLLVTFMILIGASVVKAVRSRRAGQPAAAYATPFFSILLLSVFTLVWFDLTASSAVLDTLDIIVTRVIDHLPDFLNPSTTIGLSNLQMTTISPSYAVLKYLMLFTQGLIGLGIIAMILNRGRFRLAPEYRVLATVGFGMILLEILLPLLAESMTPTRLYQASLVVLAPALVVGTALLYDLASQLYRPLRSKLVRCAPLKFLAVFLVPFFLLNVGFVQQVTGDSPYSISFDNDLNYVRFNDRELNGARWLVNTPDGSDFYGDVFGKYLINGFKFPPWKVKGFDNTTEKVAPESYIFMRTLNVRGTFMTPAPVASYERPYELVPIADTPFSEVIRQRSIIYSNGGSAILF